MDQIPLPSIIVLIGAAFSINLRAHAQRVGGALVIDHDGPHAPSEKGGRITLKGRTYPVELGFFQASGGQALALFMEGPGVPKQPVAGNMLFHDKIAR